jgi:hypothetical protein
MGFTILAATNTNARFGSVGTASETGGKTIAEEEEAALKGCVDDGCIGECFVAASSCEK